MKIEYKQEPGKGFGLHFLDTPREVRDAVVGFVNSNTQWLDAPYRRECRAAAPFIQSDDLSRSPGKTHGYLFVEFWSTPENHESFRILILDQVRALPGYENAQVLAVL